VHRVDSNESGRGVMKGPGSLLWAEERLQPAEHLSPFSGLLSAPSVLNTACVRRGQVPATQMGLVSTRCCLPGPAP